ncbi:MAG: prolyl oligopeptidase family serine peptidase [Clostridiales bacterium]|nr:prolyl oligopeptidase family serine peptidase [Clostridiales bacterium]
MRAKKWISLISVLILLSFVSGCKAKEETFTYPVTEKVDVVDDYFGTKVADPYRWLEDDKAENVKQWVEVQNRVTFGYLAKIPFRENIRQRLTEIYNYPRYSAPFRAGEYYFFYKNDGLQNQSVIYVQKGLDGEPRVFLDPNILSPDGTTRARLVGFSHDDRYTTYSRSEGGSDWQEIRVMEIATGQELEDRIQWVKFTGTAWHGNGFYYSGFDKPEEGKELTAANEYQKIFYHKLGTPQSQDKLVYEDREHPRRYHSTQVSEDEKYIFLYISEGTHGNEIYFKDLKAKKAEWVPLQVGFEYNTNVVDNLEDKFVLLTDREAPKSKIVLAEAKNPAPENWVTLVPEKSETVMSASLVGGKMFVSYLKDASTHVFQYDLSGNLEKEIELPALGSAFGFSGKKEDKILFYTFTSFTYPPTIYKYDIPSGRSEVFRKTEVKFNPEDFEAKQVFYASKDGTRIPMFIVHKKGLKLDGKRPTYLYGYGGFTSSLTPSFDVSKIILLENGGVYAMANLRGGGEYGEEWHKAGMLQNKQNVFDDFIAAAEYLIREKYTSPDKLAIAGGSNGGLLVGACMTQRPELFKVALPAVGVMDMLRFHKFTVGWGWVVEYGSSDNEEQFRYLYAYSPLHNIKEGVSYPATLVTTADHDDRVVPAHSFKFIATLQEKHRGKNPVLIRIDTKSGHGASSVTKAIEQLTDTWAFTFQNLGMTTQDK